MLKTLGRETKGFRLVSVLTPIFMIMEVVMEMIIPKLMAFIPQMAANIAETLGIAVDQVNVKATTEEKLGFTGAEQGISAYAVAGIEKL